jgi:hypothetical protein
MTDGIYGAQKPNTKKGTQLVERRRVPGYLNVRAKEEVHGKEKVL